MQRFLPFRAGSVFGLLDWVGCAGSSGALTASMDCSWVIRSCFLECSLSSCLPATRKASFLSSSQKCWAAVSLAMCVFRRTSCATSSRISDSKELGSILVAVLKTPPLLDPGWPPTVCHPSSSGGPVPVGPVGGGYESSLSCRLSALSPR
eukprot:12466355-Heterocapsa_arctica.AAC.1